MVLHSLRWRHRGTAPHPGRTSEAPTTVLVWSEGDAIEEDCMVHLRTVLMFYTVPIHFGDADAQH